MTIFIILTTLFFAVISLLPVLVASDRDAHDCIVILK